MYFMLPLLAFQMLSIWCAQQTNFPARVLNHGRRKFTSVSLIKSTLLSQNLHGSCILEESVSSYLLPVQFICLNANKSESSLTFFTEVTSVARKLDLLTVSAIYSGLLTGKKTPQNKNPQIFLGTTFPFRQQEDFPYTSASLSCHCITSFSL